MVLDFLAKQQSNKKTKETEFNEGFPQTFKNIFFLLPK
jgi:hypothetical protein